MSSFFFIFSFSKAEKRLDTLLRFRVYNKFMEMKKNEALTISRQQSKDVG
jgi:hypothetical protein